MRPHRRFARAVAALALVALLGGCAMLGKPSIGTRSFAIDAAGDLNDDRPVAVDVVFVHDEDLMERLGATSARDWFGRRDQFRRDHPQGFEVVSFEVVPGQHLPAIEVGDDRGEAHAGLVFADYRSEGEHRAQFGHLRHAVIRLGKESFTVQPAD